MGDWLSALVAMGLSRCLLDDEDGFNVSRYLYYVCCLPLLFGCVL